MSDLKAWREVPFYVNIYEFVTILRLRFMHCYLMTFPVDYDKFAI